MARNMACRREGITRESVRGDVGSAYHVVARILKCSKNFQCVTTCHDELTCHFREQLVNSEKTGHNY